MSGRRRPGAPAHYGDNTEKPPRIRFPVKCVYRGWWAETTACVGRPTAAFERVTWFTVTRISEGEAEFGGYWRPPHEIYLRLDQVRIGSLVRHEMVHDLLQLGSHNSPFFEVCVSGEG